MSQSQNPLTVLFALVAAVFPVAGFALDTSRPEVIAFVEMMSTEHGISSEQTLLILNQAETQPRIIEAMSRPAEKTKPWFEYRQIFLTEKRIAEGVEFWNAHREDLEAISERTGVPPQIIVGIIGVETFFGRITGSYRVLDALATLAFDYPPRSKFFTSELEQFLLLTQEQSIDPLTASGSYAGAMGSPQFISSSYRAYAADGDDDGRIDLWNSWADIFASVANYFKAHKWQAFERVVAPVTGTVDPGLLSNGLRLDRTVAELTAAGVAFDHSGDTGDKAMLFMLEQETGPAYWVGFQNFYVITRYNRSNMYAMAVYELGRDIAARVDDGSTPD
ncbi:MAG: lytic murein transglycosylase B [Gammaproteobacteria bacterium]